jgi:hypothetical protein
MDAARESRRRAKERPPRAHGFGANGTVAKPFGGGALSLAGNALADEGPRGGAASSLLRPPWAAVAAAFSLGRG